MFNQKTLFSSSKPHKTSKPSPKMGLLVLETLAICVMHPEGAIVYSAGILVCTVHPSGTLVFTVFPAGTIVYSIPFRYSSVYSTPCRYSSVYSTPCRYTAGASMGQQPPCPGPAACPVGP